MRYGADQDLRVAHEIGESVMLDNGAFSQWTKGKAVDWNTYYRWCEPWLAYQTTWAVIPDVIGGDEKINDALLATWPFGVRGAPVWHMHESLERLKALTERWPKVCIGSSAEYQQPGSVAWNARIANAMSFICQNGVAPCWLHMLRAMHQAVSGKYPFASADSTNIARNFKGDSRGRPAKDIFHMALQIDAKQQARIWKCNS